MQNITQSREISFGDFLEDIITKYLGLFYENLPKHVQYNNERMVFDQLFIYENKIYMIEQKIRDDHDSTKKHGQFSNFLKKVKYLNETYPNYSVSASMWFMDNNLTKNQNYYLKQLKEINKDVKAELNLFYAEELFVYLDKISIWDEMTSHLLQWKVANSSVVELNFENNWEETKEEIYKNVSKATWEKLLGNLQVVEEIFPILFPTEKYKEIIFK